MYTPFFDDNSSLHLDSEYQFMRAECRQSLERSSFLIEPSHHDFKIVYKLIVVIGWGITVKVLLDALNGTINSITKSTVFFSLQPEIN